MHCLTSGSCRAPESPVFKTLLTAACDYAYSKLKDNPTHAPDCPDAQCPICHRAGTVSARLECRKRMCGRCARAYKRDLENLSNAQLTSHRKDVSSQPSYCLFADIHDPPQGQSRRKYGRGAAKRTSQPSRRDHPRAQQMGAGKSHSIKQVRSSRSYLRESKPCPTAISYDPKLLSGAPCDVTIQPNVNAGW